MKEWPAVNCVRNLFLMVFSQLDTTILVDLPLSAAQLLPQWDEIFLKEHFDLGGIQQLRGQEEGEGGSAKSPHLSTQGGGGGGP
jgi:hypothetical protein